MWLKNMPRMAGTLHPENPLISPLPIRESAKILQEIELCKNSAVILESNDL